MEKHPSPLEALVVDVKPVGAYSDAVKAVLGDSPQAAEALADVPPPMEWDTSVPFDAKKYSDFMRKKRQLEVVIPRRVKKLTGQYRR